MRAENIAKLKELYEALLIYAQQARFPGTPAIIAFGFQAGQAGDRVVKGQMSWQTWKDQYFYPSALALPQYLQLSNDAWDRALADQIVGWYTDVAAPAFVQINVSETAASAIDPLKDVASQAGDAVTGAIPGWVWVAGGGVLLFLLLDKASFLAGLFKGGKAEPKPRPAVAGYKRRKARR